MRAEYQAILDQIDSDIDAMRRGEADPRKVLRGIQDTRADVRRAVAVIDARKAQILRAMPLAKRTPRPHTAPTRSTRTDLRPREHRSGRRHATRGSPDDPEPEHAPGDDTPVNVAWQALLDTLNADWQYRHIAKLCLLRSRWLRRWWR